jgi:hypothetical protein
MTRQQDLKRRALAGRTHNLHCAALVSNDPLDNARRCRRLGAMDEARCASTRDAL